MGVDPISLGIIAIAAGAAYGGMRMSEESALRKRKSAEQPGAPALPSAPTYASAIEGAEGLKKTARRRTSTILTSPLKGGEEFGAAAPTLLGSGKGKKLTGE